MHFFFSTFAIVFKFLFFLCPPKSSHKDHWVPFSDTSPFLWHCCHRTDNNNNCALNQSSTTSSDVQDSREDCALNQSSTTSSNAQDSREDCALNQSSAICCNVHDLRKDSTDSHQLLTTSLNAPKQPILKEYNRKTFGTETSSRDFNPQWYKTYPWISFDIVGNRGVHRVGYKRSTRPDKISNKPEHDPIPERRKPDDPNPTRQWIT